MESNGEFFKKPVTPTVDWVDDDEVTITFGTLRRAMREGHELGLAEAQRRVATLHWDTCESSMFGCLCAIPLAQVAALFTTN